MPAALIVGAGIGGLSAAIALRRAGWDVTIVERAASPRELGFGLALAPNAMAALGELGVADRVMARAFAPDILRGEFRRVDGRVLKRAAFPPRAALGGPLVIALRPALHGALVDAVGVDRIRLGSHALAFRDTAAGVSLTLDGGITLDADLLVGADGIGSVVRRQLHPAEAPPRSSGIVAVRGAVHGLTDRLDGLGGIYYLGRGIEAFLVRASDTGIYWALSLARTLVPAEMRDPAAVVAHMAPQLDATLRAVTAATADMRVDELVDRDALPVWGRGRVTLLGDAAHPVLPHTGQGAAQAIVDAVELGKALTATADVERALRAYERARQPRTSALLAQGRRTARLMRSTNPVFCGLREVAVRLVPVETAVKLIVRINRRAGTDVTATDSQSPAGIDVS